MKHLIPILIFLLCISSGVANDNAKIDIILKNGTVFKDSTVVHDEPTYITVVNQDGINQIFKKELSEETLRYYPLREEKNKSQKPQRAQTQKPPSSLRDRILRLNQINDPEPKNNLHVEYQSYIHIRKKEETRIKNHKLPKEEADVIRSSIPLGGRIVVLIERPTIGSANTEYFTVLLSDSKNKEILRHKGEFDIAKTPGSSGLWWNTLLINIPEAFEPPVTVRVIDDLQNSATDFILK